LNIAVYIGVKTKIKLLKDESGKAIFPRSFTALSREGKVYIRNNFIGDRIAFTAGEFIAIKSDCILLFEIVSDIELDFQL
jgi:hypothetical protein